MRPDYLVDKSALTRLHLEPVRAVLGPLLVDGLLATCAIVDLEVLYSARSPSEYRIVLRERAEDFATLELTQAICTRAIEVQSLLAERAEHRTCGIADLLIAACAESHSVPILHYDRNFDLIASVTGQSAHWVVAQGSVQ